MVFSPEGGSVVHEVVAEAVGGGGGGKNIPPKSDHFL